MGLWWTIDKLSQKNNNKQPCVMFDMSAALDTIEKSIIVQGCHDTFALPLIW